MKREPHAPIHIRTPCPKRWEELVGDERKRFCSECCLHVHNAAALTQREARALVSEATGRVCLRIEYDAQGAPVHRETRIQRLARWAVASGAALLAACQGGSPVAPPEQPAPVEPPSLMGRMVAPELLGGVTEPPGESQLRATLGEASTPPVERIGGPGDPVPAPKELLGDVAPTPAPGPVPPK
jgi:hypothetical protein